MARRPHDAALLAYEGTQLRAAAQRAGQSRVRVALRGEQLRSAVAALLARQGGVGQSARGCRRDWPAGRDDPADPHRLRLRAHDRLRDGRQAAIPVRARNDGLCRRRSRRNARRARKGPARKCCTRRTAAGRARPPWSNSRAGTSPKFTMASKPPGCRRAGGREGARRCGQRAPCSSARVWPPRCRPRRRTPRQAAPTTPTRAAPRPRLPRVRVRR